MGLSPLVQMFAFHGLKNSRFEMARWGRSMLRVGIVG